MQSTEWATPFGIRVLTFGLRGLARALVIAAHAPLTPPLPAVRRFGLLRGIYP